MKQIINEEIAKRYSFFTQDENLIPDEFYLFEDVSYEDTVKMDRLKQLKDKSYNTEAEKEEIASLLEELKDCMINSETWSKVVCSIYSMQIYMRDEIVVFIRDKQDEFSNMLDEFKFVGEWNNTTSYKKGNQVFYNGQGYQSRIDNNLGNVPNEDSIMNDYWVRYTLKGDKGEPSLNIFCKGQYDPTYTYSLSTGDACIYKGLLYYVLEEGVTGIAPENSNKWKVIEECVKSDSPPSNTNVIWFNSINNTFSKHDGNSWVESTLNGKTANGNLGTNEKVDLAIAITEVNTKVDETLTDVNNIKIKQNKFTEDSSGRLLYNGKNVGVTTASELPIKSISGLNATNVQEMGQQLFTFANNGKNAIASVVGNVNSNSTHTQIKDEIQNDKNILARNLTNKGISATNTEILSSLANKVNDITIQSLGGRKYATGTVPFTGSSGTVNLGFRPTSVIIKSPYPEYYDEDRIFSFMFVVGSDLIGSFYAYSNRSNMFLYQGGIGFTDTGFRVYLEHSSIDPNSTYIAIG